MLQHTRRAATGSCRAVAAPAVPTAAAAATPSWARTQQRGSLRLFLDSADITQWERWAPTGTLWGFTTNPLILQRDGVPCTLDSCRQLMAAVQKLGVQELQCQAWGGGADALEACARALLELDPTFITVKLPCTTPGLTAAAAVLRTDPQASVTITGVYEPFQAVMAQAVGANYVAPYLMRMAAQIQGAVQQGGDSAQQAAFAAALEKVCDMQAAVRASGSSVRVLVASIKSADSIAALAARGCDTFTFGPPVMEQLCRLPVTERAAADFEAAAAANA